MIGPIVNVVEWSVKDEALRRVALVVEHEYDGIEAVANDGRQLLSRHLESAVTHENHWA
jgi:hypothetical protein